MPIRWDYVGAATGTASLLWQIFKHFIDTRERLRLVISSTQTSARGVKVSTLNVDATNTSPSRRVELRPYIWIAIEGSNQSGELPDQPFPFWHPKRRWTWDCLPARTLNSESDSELTDVPLEPRSSVGLMAPVNRAILPRAKCVAVEDTLGRVHTSSQRELADWKRRSAQLEQILARG